MSQSILEGKRILAVDDEPDILESIKELLEGYKGLILDTAKDYETGYHLLRSWTYDAVILDIMGVRGFDLLNAAVHLGFPAIMLSAHAVSPESIKKSIELGARAFIPKEKMFDIPIFLEDVLRLEHSSALKRLFDRLANYFDSRFGKDWQKDEESFWKEVLSGKFEPTIIK